MNQDQLWDYYQTKALESFDQAYPRLKFLAGLAGIGSVLNIGIGTGEQERYLL